MELQLKIHFNTDGDFCFLGLDRLIDPKSSFYNGAVKNFIIDNQPDYETIDILLGCNGDANGCRWAARDVLEHLVTNGFRVVHYWLVKDLYDLLITPKEDVLWSDENVHYQNTISGNYDGTVLRLDIVH